MPELTNPDGQEREALASEQKAAMEAAFGAWTPDGDIIGRKWPSPSECFEAGFRAALTVREEPPTHFEWPEHYEVGETQTTACEIPLDGRSHTSYRKEVTCVACLQTMLGAREDTERPDETETREPPAGTSTRVHGQRRRVGQWEDLDADGNVIVRDTKQEHSAEPDTREAVSADDLGDAIG